MSGDVAEYKKDLTEAKSEQDDMQDFCSYKYCPTKGNAIIGAHIGEFGESYCDEDCENLDLAYWHLKQVSKKYMMFEFIKSFINDKLRNKRKKMKALIELLKELRKK